MVGRMSANGLPVTYLTPQGSCYTFGNAFAKGCGGRAITSLKFRRADFSAFVNPEIYPVLRDAQKNGVNWYYGDHAYFGRKFYFRVSKNAYQHDALRDAKPDRFEKLRFPIQNWRGGSKILLCPQSDVFMRLHGISQEQWIQDTTETLRKYTDRKIRVHLKSHSSLMWQTERQFWQALLDDIYAVVVYTSVAGVQAVLNGVPCFATEKCASASFGSMDLSKIETPKKPDNREEMAWVLADNQWTLDEIAKGMAWEKLRNQ
jgi:hypothetical protein